MYTKRSIGFALAYCLFQAVVPANAYGQPIARHPTPENLRVEGRSVSVGARDTISQLAELNLLASRLRRARRADSIGTLDDDPDTVLGTIMDVAVTPDGRIVIIDVANLALRVFNEKGKPMFSIGQRGGGPLDFRFPIAVWSGGADSIVVVDVQHGVKILVLRDARTARLARTFALDGSPTGACAANGKVAIYAPSIERASKLSDVPPLVRVYHSGGTFERAFGESYRSESALVRSDMSEGVVGCASSGHYAIALSKLPFLRGYSATGAKLWTIRFSDFVLGKHVEEINRRGVPAIGLDPRDPTNSYIRRLTALGDKMLVQVGLMTPASLRDRSLWSRIDSYLVDMRSGNAVFVSSNLPLISGMTGTQLIGFENDPYPRVVRLTLESHGR